MARQTKTTYTCDSCGSEVTRQKELTIFGLEVGRTYRTIRTVRTELCDECEGKFLGAVSPFFRDALAGELMEMRRES